MSFDLRHTAVIEDMNEFYLASTSPDSGPSPVNDILLLEEGVLAAVVLRKSSIHAEHTKTQRWE